ncbi:hypothetical protein GCM10009836_34310 [Pseudonocardia ailaonensis]|uniref:3-hydroxyacyl-CoA dehydrogenase n=1 Tax=Pseudonocardia ailaonensis TaxID=367279 RepID=A0ABN2N849_9PSEU
MSTDAEQKPDADRPPPAAGRTVIGCVGAGQMGAGIAATAVVSGLGAVLRDVSAANLETARGRAVRAGGRAGLEPDEVLAHWSATAGWEGFEAADVVIEAVFEEPGLKRETLRAVSEVVGAGTVIATNTSAIPIASLAGAVTDDTRFLGTHFFSPVERMPLVELVPHTGTAPRTVARAAELARTLGKTPIVVADVPGFFTSRVYARWLIEATRLLLDGVDPAQVEEEAAEIGFPVGPLRAHDEVTVDLVVRASLTQVGRPVLAGRIDVDAVERALRTLIAAGVEGRRQGEGFYAYADGRRTGPNPRIPELLGLTPRRVMSGEAGERLLLAFVSESLLCWDDGTLCHPDDGDTASVLGIGFPPGLAGPFRYADDIGAAALVERLERLGSPAFPVARSLRALVADGGTYAGQRRRPTPGAVL